MKLWSNARYSKDDLNMSALKTQHSFTGCQGFNAYNNHHWCLVWSLHCLQLLNAGNVIRVARNNWGESSRDAKRSIKELDTPQISNTERLHGELDVELHKHNVVLVVTNDRGQCCDQRVIIFVLSQNKWTNRGSTCCELSHSFSFHIGIAVFLSWTMNSRLFFDTLDNI